MLRILKMASCVAAAIAASPAGAASFTIDFESYSTSDTILAGTDLGGGLSFAQDLRINNDGLLQNSPATTSNVAFAPAPPFFQGDDVVGSFTSSVDSLRIGAGDLGFDRDTVVLTAFDAMMNIVGSDSFSGVASQFLEVAGAGITSFSLEFDDVRPPAGTGSGGFDNITFNVTPVPLPATLPLLGFGLASLMMMRRRLNG